MPSPSAAAPPPRDRARGRVVGGVAVADHAAREHGVRALGGREPGEVHVDRRGRAARRRRSAPRPRGARRSPCRSRTLRRTGRRCGRWGARRPRRRSCRRRWGRGRSRRTSAGKKGALAASAILPPPAGARGGLAAAEEAAEPSRRRGSSPLLQAARARAASASARRVARAAAGCEASEADRSLAPFFIASQSLVPGGHGPPRARRSAPAGLPRGEPFSTALSPALSRPLPGAGRGPGKTREPPPGTRLALHPPSVLQRARPHLPSSPPPAPARLHAHRDARRARDDLAARGGRVAVVRRGDARPAGEPGGDAARRLLPHRAHAGDRARAADAGHVQRQRERPADATRAARGGSR